MPAVPPIDTVPPAPNPGTNPDFAACESCEGRDKFEENRWSFKAGNSFVCGIIDTAIANSERTAFTFFGPSACSTDTSMAVSVYLDPYKLDKSQHGLLITKIAFYFNKFGLSDHF